MRGFNVAEVEQEQGPVGKRGGAGGREMPHWPTHAKPQADEPKKGSKFCMGGVSSGG